MMQARNRKGYNMKNFLIALNWILGSIFLFLGLKRLAKDSAPEILRNNQ